VHSRGISIPETQRVLRADATCVKQADIDEHSPQVRLMGDIYRNGKELQIWLGEVKEIRSCGGALGEDGGRHQSHSDHHEVMDSRYLSREKNPTFKNFLISDGHSTAPESLVPSAAKDIDTDVLGISDQLKLVAHKKHFYEMPFFEFTTGMGIDFDPFWCRVMALFVGILTRPWWKRV